MQFSDSFLYPLKKTYFISEEIKEEYWPEMNFLKQPISKPTHLPRTSNSCIDLTFTNQPNMVILKYPRRTENFQNQ